MQVCNSLPIVLHVDKSMSQKTFKHTSSCIVAPGDVKPGHMMFAPDMTNFSAPLSTLNFFIISGY